MKTYQGHIVDVVRREVYDGEVVVEGDRIKQVKRCKLPDKHLWDSKNMQVYY